MHRGCAEPLLTSFEGEVDRIAVVCRTLGTPSLHVVGYSLGGRLALGLATRHPTLCASVTVIGGQPGLSNASAREERLAADARWSDLLDREGLDAFFEGWQAQPLFASQSSFPDQVAARQRRLRAHHSARGLAQAMACLGLGAMPDLWPRLPAVQVPVRLITGESDLKFSAIATQMAAALPNSEKRAILGCGHNPLLERPEALGEMLHYPFQGRSTS